MKSQINIPLSSPTNESLLKRRCCCCRRCRNRWNWLAINDATPKSLDATPNCKQSRLIAFYSNKTGLRHWRWEEGSGEELVVRRGIGSESGAVGCRRAGERTLVSKGSQTFKTSFTTITRREASKSSSGVGFALELMMLYVEELKRTTTRNRRINRMTKWREIQSRKTEKDEEMVGQVRGRLKWERLAKWKRGGLMRWL